MVSIHPLRGHSTSKGGDLGPQLQQRPYRLEPEPRRERPRPWVIPVRPGELHLGMPSQHPLDERRPDAGAPRIRIDDELELVGADDRGAALDLDECALPATELNEGLVGERRLAVRGDRALDEPAERLRNRRARQHDRSRPPRRR